MSFIICCLFLMPSPSTETTVSATNFAAAVLSALPVASPQIGEYRYHLTRRKHGLRGVVQTLWRLPASNSPSDYAWRSWRKGPFSHVGLQKAQESAAARLAKLDTLVAGPGAVTLTWQGATAVLAVNTMTGADTIEAIDSAYGEIVTRKAEKLIIDLRRNDGGAFAVVPLVGHLIDKPIDAGVFVVSSWYADHQSPPGRADFASAVPWRGYSVSKFQTDVTARPLTSYRIDPMLPLFRGPVSVLTSARSISAAEIATDALQSIGRAKVIGENTPGVCLSSRVFDIPGGFHLRVPIADYYSNTGVRLEGVGVTPDVSVSADQALEVALGR